MPKFQILYRKDSNVMSELPIKKRKNQSEFDKYHNQIFGLIEQGYSIPQIFEYLKQESQNDEMLLNGLYSFIRRKKAKGLNKVIPENHQSTEELSKPIQPEETKQIEEVNTSKPNFSSVVNSSNSKSESPNEIMKRKFGDTPPPKKNDGFN